MKSIEQQLSDEITRQLVGETKKIISALKEVTPVDTGFARDQWEMSQKSGMVIIENEAPYIQKLNEGSSAQAPTNFVEQTVLNFGKPSGSIVVVK